MNKDDFVTMLLAIAILTILWFGIGRTIKTVRKCFVEAAEEVVFQKNIEIANFVLGKMR
jgi:hypothetical protein